jgi:hypothetical protein
MTDGGWQKEEMTDDRWEEKMTDERWQKEEMTDDRERLTVGSW